MVAAKRGDLLALGTLLHALRAAVGEGGYWAEVNAADRRGDTALALAAKLGHATAVRLLLEEGASPLPANGRGERALHHAALAGHVDVIAALCDARVPRPAGGHGPAARAPVPERGGGAAPCVDARSAQGFSPLHLAAAARHPRAAAALLARGATPDWPVMRNIDRIPVLCGGSTALHIAASLGDHRTAAVIIAAAARSPGADIRRVRNLLGMSSLNVALVGGHNGVLRLLLEQPRAARPAVEQLPEGAAALLPETLRAHMLAALQRAALLVQLRAIARGAEGGGAADPASEAADGLEALSLGRIRRLRRLLARPDAALPRTLSRIEAELRPSGAPPPPLRAASDSEEDGDESEEALLADPAEAAPRGARALALHDRLAAALEALADAAALPAPPAPPPRPTGGCGSGKRRAALSSSEDECAICMDAAADVELQPCAHRMCFACSCRMCGHAGGRGAEVQCAFCRASIEGFSSRRASAGPGLAMAAAKLAPATPGPAAQRPAAA
jgi:ankyrin repeat protein